MNIKKYEMPFKERMEFDWFTAHWQILVIVILLSLLIGIILFVSATKVDGEKRSNRKIGGTFFAIVGGVLLIFLLSHFLTIKTNAEHLHYMTYRGQGEVIHVENKYDNNDVTFQMGAEKYQITVDKKYIVDIGDEIKVSSNGKIPTKDMRKEYENNFTRNSMKSGHKLDVKLNKHGLWFNTDAYTK